MYGLRVHEALHERAGDCESIESLMRALSTYLEDVGLVCVCVLQTYMCFYNNRTCPSFANSVTLSFLAVQQSGRELATQASDIVPFIDGLHALRSSRRPLRACLLPR